MKTDLKHGSVTDQILRVFYDVYNELGHGFLESVYHRSLVVALESVGLSVVVEWLFRCGFEDIKWATSKRIYLSNDACCLS
jgi:GxxExxY protein